MSKKIIIMSFIAVFLVLFFRLTRTSAQRYERDSGDFTALEEKIDKVLSSLPEKGNQDEVHRQISAKLEQIIGNQRKILDELEVIKIRATRR